MALTAEGTRLTAEHRRAQARVSVALVRDVLGLWRLLDPYRLDATRPTWAQRVLDLIGRHRSKSERLALDYFTEFRRAELGPDLGGQRVPPVTEILENPWRDAAEVSLLVTGPSTVKRLSAAGLDPSDAAERAGPGVAAAALRHAAGGGRGALDQAINADRLALGYQRVTGPKPCAFCAMLASRGPIYSSSTSGSTTMRGGKPDDYHDGCGCTAEPVYDVATDLPASSQRFADLWESVVVENGLSGKEARNAFRRAHEAQLRAT
ncbi:hypothetical protein [Lentzea sp. NBRC 102530]|uniref:VG15 protein n=1 Tax=Lentzea sp. NBRC 102530 TaxID=3032201 RepID=UPI0024A1831E|nr:hypothetical protein [Lentzea sp. NBRC 102530]GLY51305.1 hypothetical protein Lesp01_49610 [Lentzea sp. NBRC 102530]